MDVSTILVKRLRKKKTVEHFKTYYSYTTIKTIYFHLPSLPFFFFTVKTYSISIMCQELGKGVQKAILQHILKEVSNP